MQRTHIALALDGKDVVGASVLAAHLTAAATLCLAFDGALETRLAGSSGRLRGLGGADSAALAGDGHENVAVTALGAGHVRARVYRTGLVERAAARTAGLARHHPWWHLQWKPQ
jgi:hypothetical protein